MGCEASELAKPGTQGQSFCAVPRWSTVTMMLPGIRPGGWVAPPQSRIRTMNHSWPCRSRHGQRDPTHWKHLTSPLLILI